MNTWQELEALYNKAVTAVSEEPRDRVPEALDLDRFEAVLNATSWYSDSIFREECLSLLFELRGNLSLAVSHRQREIALIRQFLADGTQSGDREATAYFYDQADLADRLELLAIKLHEAGMLDEAISALLEAKSLSIEWRFVFESEEFLDSLQKERIELLRASAVATERTKGGWSVAKEWAHESVRKILEHGDPIDFITNRARQLALSAMESGWSGPPFSPFALADVLRIPVVPRDNIREGRLVPIEDNRVQIEYNPNAPRSRMHFTVAHEIAHTLFPDCADAVRNRLSASEMGHEDSQLEMLCNIAASELLMPIGSFLHELEQADLGVDQIISLSDSFRVSTEAVFIRTIRLTNKPCVMFAASASDDESSPYRVDYSLASRSWGFVLPPGLSIPAGSVVENCVANLFTGKGREEWPGLAQGVHVEAVGVPPYPGRSKARVLGLLTPTTSVAQPTNRMKFVYGDATSPCGHGKKVITHIVNDKARHWGGGFAKALATKWPHVHREYTEWFNSGRRQLGDLHVAAADDDISIASMVAQHGYGRSATLRLRYRVLESVLEKVGEYTFGTDASVHMPRIGSGQAGGEWPIVQELIDEVLCKTGVGVTVYTVPNARDAKGNPQGMLFS